MSKRKNQSKNKSKLTRDVVFVRITIILTACLVGTILLYIIASILTFGNGGVHGYLLEHQSFPGTSSRQVSSGRKDLTDELASINNQIANLTPKPLYVSNQFSYIDVCVKDTHTSGFAGGTKDPYAYWCTLSLKQYYAYGQSKCDIITALKRIPDIKIGVNDKCTGDSAVFTSDKTDIDGGPLVTLVVEDKTDYIRETQSLLSNFDQIACTDGRTVVFCDHKNSNELGKIPLSTQSIVGIDLTQVTYYEK